jgi:hypothetical protein
VRGCSQHGLPANTTAGQHAFDFDAALGSNAPKGQYGHKDNWQEIGKGYKAKVAHARLIKGDYGIPSPHACERCASKDLACRIYNPDLRAARVNQGPCGECRLKGDSSGINSSIHCKVGKKRTASNVAPNESNPKILRRSTGGDTSVLDYCPVLTCPRRTRPFNNKANLLRHITSAHPDYDPSRLNITRHLSTPSHRVASTPGTASLLGRTPCGMGTFVCPVVDCSNPNASRGDNLRRHVRLKHPDTVHAQLLEAVLKKTRMTLPHPP